MSKIKHNQAIAIFQMVLAFIQNILSALKIQKSSDVSNDSSDAAANDIVSTDINDVLSANAEE